MKAEDAAEWLENAAIDRGQSVFNDCAQAIRELIEERDSLKYIFDLSYAAQMRAIAAWQERHDEPLTWPDHERLVIWLIEERERLQEALRGLLRHSGVADMDPEDKSPEDIEAEKAARAALEPKP